MLRKQYSVAFIGLTAAVLASTGCTTALKQTYYGVTGAKGKFYEVKVVDSGVLATYRSIKVEKFTNELGERVPPKVIAEVNERTPQMVADAELFYPDGKSLVVKGRIVHFTGKSGLKGSVGSVIGGGEECVCRVQLVDGASGDLVGEAVCWGIVKSAIRRGSGELGEGVGDGVVKWLEERLPDDAKETRKKEIKSE